MHAHIKISNSARDVLQIRPPAERAQVAFGSGFRHTPPSFLYVLAFPWPRLLILLRKLHVFHDSGYPSARSWPTWAPFWLDLGPLGHPLAQSWLTLAFLCFHLARSWSPFAALWIDYGSLLLPFGSIMLNIAPLWLEHGPLLLPSSLIMARFGAQIKGIFSDSGQLCFDRKLQPPYSGSFERS